MGAPTIAADQFDGPVYINQPDIVEVTRKNPGQVYVGVLPGHRRPAFVRKRRSSCFRLPRLFDPRRSYSSETIYRRVIRAPSRHCSASHYTNVYTEQPVYVNDSGPRPLPAYVHLPPYPPERTGKHTCGACGKFRSPSYCKRHPLADGEEPKPSLCRKCAKGSTDSGSDDSYAKYLKERKHRRRREKESTEERHERYRRERRYSKRKPYSSSAEYSYERSREEKRYRGPRRIYSVDERSSHSEWERRREPRIIYVNRSSSRGYTHSSSGGSSVVVSYKSREPRKLPRSRSSAEEIRIVRRVVSDSESRRRPRSRSVSERSYRSRYHSRSRSSGEKSVRFRSPPRERPSRRYRRHGYDGELASTEDYDHMHKRNGPEFVEIPHSRRPRPLQYSTSFTGTRQQNGRISYSHVPAPPSSRTVRYIRGSSELRDGFHYRTRANERQTRPSNVALVTGARGSSLSSDRDAFERATSRERSEAGSRTGSPTRYTTPSNESSVNYIPEDHSSYRRRTQTPVRTSRLMLRLYQENSEHWETVPDAPPALKPEITYRHVRRRSPPLLQNASRRPSSSPEIRYRHVRGRSPISQQSSQRHHSRSRSEGHGEGNVHYKKELRRTASDERRPDVDSRSSDFGGRVRYVRAPQRSSR